MSRPNSVLYSSFSHLRRLAAALLCIVVLLGCAYAQDAAAVPPLVKFGGTVAGAPAGTTGAIFALYKDQTGGAPLWQEVQNITLDANGRYTAYLGARSTRGLPVDLFSSGEARWLGVQPDGQPEQPRILLVSVPYALKASDAQTLGGLPASAFLRAEASSAAASSAAYVNSAAVAAAATGLSAHPAVTTGQAGYFPVFTDSTDMGNSALFQLAGNNTTYLGFGTTTPSFNLHFVSEVDPAAVTVDGYGAVGINFIGRRAQGTRANPSAILLNDNIMTMQGRGYGTSAFSAASRAYMKFFAAENWTDAAQGTYMTLATTAIGSSASAEHLRILDSGNVGIGTTTPAFPLSVNGAIQSLTGGFKFPDGTTQTTAATGTGGSVTVTSPDSSITVGGTTSAPTVIVNTTNIQKRVTGTCTTNNAISSISSTGTVTCQTVSGGGAVTYPVNWSSSSTAPNGVLNVTGTSTGPTMPSNGPPDFNTVPAAIAAKATGTGVTVAVRGQATGTQGFGIFGYTTTSNNPPIVAWNGVTGFTANGTNGDWPYGLMAGMTNAGGTAINAQASAATAPTCTTANESYCQPTIGVSSKVDATSGQTIGFYSRLRSASATGLQLQFNTPPTSGAMINASVDCSGGSNCPNFNVDGNGNVNVSGNLNVNGNVNKSGGNFKIDHPLDPANKYLYHSFVESPDMLNIYNGVIVLDKRGKAVVQLPDYFEALNQDFRYQLTAVGAPGPNLFVAGEIKGNQFIIAGGKPGAKVSWQVTGVRHDAYAEAHRTIVVEDKGKERGTYMHPELFQQTPVLARK